MTSQYIYMIFLTILEDEGIIPISRKEFLFVSGRDSKLQSSWKVQFIADANKINEFADNQRSNNNTNNNNNNNKSFLTKLEGDLICNGILID